MSGFIEELVNDDLLGVCLDGVAEGQDGIGEIDGFMVNAESLKLEKIGGFCVFRNHYQAIKEKTPQDKLAVSFSVC
jgi:hypothetical protein